MVSRVTKPNLTDSVNAMVKIARGYPGCVQSHNSKDGLRVHLKVEDGYIFFNMSRKDDFPTRDEYMLAVQGVRADNDLASLRVLVWERKYVITVWEDYE